MDTQKDIENALCSCQFLCQSCAEQEQHLNTSMVAYILIETSEEKKGLCWVELKYSRFYYTRKEAIRRRHINSRTLY